MATVVGGVGYGLYFISKIALPISFSSPAYAEKLDQDKTTVDEQFDKAFATLEQLAKDTEALKASEAARTEKLDKALEEIEELVRASKSASRRQEGETERLRDDIKNIHAAIPRSLAAHKKSTDGRLKEIGNEMKSLKSLISQRMNSAQPSVPSPMSSSVPQYNGGAGAQLRPTSANATSTSPAITPSAEVKEDGILNGSSSAQDENKIGPFGSGAPAAKASIPAWQMAANSSKASENAMPSRARPTKRV
ncbi:hypothetical protein NUW58_g9917 [Xylaria curta]|uniref:Uncharacterized protein n=1 Tax=Xylaria curta TaxID=42375 RepID=A0ACC1MSR6_9PEZI|nr:hypothetical protein NUW58_g9917 [Xylaria curta]